MYWLFWVVKGKEKQGSRSVTLADKETAENISDRSDDEDTEVRGRGRPKLSQKEKERRAREAPQTKKPRGRPRKSRDVSTPIRMGGIDSFFSNHTDK